MNLGKLLKSGSKVLFQHESSAAVEKPWAEPSSQLLNGAVECSEPGQGAKNTPVHFLTRYAWENSLGIQVGVCGSVVFSPWVPHANAVQLETPWAHPQEADNSVDMPVATEEVASVITNKQSAKVHGLGGCQNKFDIKLFCLFGFCLVVWRCFSCFLTFKSHVWQDFHPLTPSLCPQKKPQKNQKTTKLWNC